MPIMTEAWWFPILAITVAAFLWVIIVGILSSLVPRDSRKKLAGIFLVVLIAAAAISYGYAVLTPSPTYPVAEAECLGPPYEVC